MSYKVTFLSKPESLEKLSLENVEKLKEAIKIANDLVDSEGMYAARVHGSDGHCKYVRVSSRNVKITLKK